MQNALAVEQHIHIHRVARISSHHEGATQGRIEDIAGGEVRLRGVVPAIHGRAEHSRTDRKAEIAGIDLGSDAAAEHERVGDPTKVAREIGHQRPGPAGVRGGPQAWRGIGLVQHRQHPFGHLVDDERAAGSTGHKFVSRALIQGEGPGEVVGRAGVERRANAIDDRHRAGRGVGAIHAEAGAEWIALGWIVVGAVDAEVVRRDKQLRLIRI